MHPPRDLVAGLVVAALVSGLVGCSDDPTGAEPLPDEAPLTARAAAAVTAEVLELEPSAAGSSPSDVRRTGPGTVAAQLRLPDDGTGSFGTLVTIIVSEPVDVCATRSNDGCETEDVDGGDLTVLWHEVEPEEDPGQVVVSLRRESESITVSTSGEEILGDPRNQDLEQSVDDLIDVVADPRLSLLTTQAVVDLGAGYEPWGGGT